MIRGAEGRVLNRFWSPEIGSDAFKIMERLVDRGKLKRNAFGDFQIANNHRGQD
jgi:hypothetical protein